MITILILFLSYQTSIKAEGIHWDGMYKTDYAILLHRIEVIYVNESYGKLDRCEFVKYNRTYQRTFNASGTLFKPVDEKRLIIKVQMYKFLSNTYKYFPITVDINACQEYERNSFDLRTKLSLYTNIHSCPPKPGFLYATYLLIDTPRLPPLMPKGDYKQKLEIFNRDDKLIHVESYGSIVDQSREPKQDAIY